MVDSLYVMALVCVNPDHIHAYSREAAQWVQRIGEKFPEHKTDPAYLHASQQMAAKDKAMQAIQEYRHQQRQLSPA